MILFFYGDNDFMIRREVERVRSHYRQKVGSSLSLELFDLSERPIGQAIDAVAAAPLFAGSRLIVLRGLAGNKKAQEQIDQLIEVVPDSTVLIIEGVGMDRRSKAYKTLVSLPKATEFKAIAPARLARWVVRQTSQMGGTISPENANYLIKQTGNDLWTLHSELQKLVSYNKEITKTSIDELSTVKTESTIFILIENIASHNLSASLELYEKLAHSGVGDQQIIAMLNWHYRSIALAIDNLKSRDLSWAGKFAIAPFAAQKATFLAGKLDLADCRQAYRNIIRADESIKSGDKSSRDAILDLIYQLAS